MNLINHFESNPFIFYLVSFGIFSGMGTILLSAVRYGRKERLF
jgi:Na+-driven multidrug efflux pump